MIPKYTWSSPFNSLHAGYFFHIFVVSLFSKLQIKKKYFRITILVSNSLDPDQVQHLAKMSDLIWIQTFCKDYQQMRNAATSEKRVKLPPPTHTNTLSILIEKRECAPKIRLKWVFRTIDLSEFE